MAGSRIKGITIEIDGNTTRLQKALQGTNKDLKNTQSSLKDVNKLLKLDPTNVTLLKQKQELLKKAVEDTKKKLDTEKEALRQLKEADQTPEIVEQQEALERQIIADEDALKKLQSQMGPFSSAGMQAFFAVGEKVKDVGKKIMDVGESITQHVTLPLAAIGGASIAAFKSVDDGYDEMIKKTGATGEAAEELRGIMNNLATDIPTDFETAGKAVGEVNTRFGVTGDELESLSGKFVKFADLNNTDVSTSIDNVQKALSAYGLGADAAEGYLDMLNRTGQETGISVDKLSQGLVTNGAAFQELGLSIEQSTVFMGQLEKSGANSETVLNGMRKALKNATNEGKPLNEALEELQETIVNGKDGMDGLTAAYDLFGKSGDQIYAAVKNGTVDFKSLGEAVTDAGGNIERTFAETQDPVDDFKKVLNQAKIAGSELGATLLTALTPILQKISEGIQWIKEKWEGLSPETQDMIVKAGMIAAVVGPIVTLLGGLVMAIGALMSPIGLVVLAIGAAIAAGIAIYKNWDKIKAKAKELADMIKAKFEAIKQAIVDKFTQAKNFIVGIWNNIKTFVTNTINNIKTTVTNIFIAIATVIQARMTFIKNTISNIWSAIKNFFSTIWEGIKSIVTGAVDAVSSKVTGVFNAIQTTVTTVWNGIKTTISTVWEGIKTAVSTGVNFIKGLLNFNGIAGAVSGAFEAIKTAITSPIETARDLVSRAIGFIKGLFPLNIGKIFGDIKLPHFNVDPGAAPWGLMGKGRKPSFSIDWYARGGIFQDPTIFATPYGFKGVGEAGAEAVLPLTELWEHMHMMGNEIVQGVTASNQTSADLMYRAMITAFREMSFTIDNREFARILRDHGAIA